MPRVQGVPASAPSKVDVPPSAPVSCSSITAVTCAGQDYFVGTVELMPAARQGPKLVSFFLWKKWAQKASERASAWWTCRCSRVPTLAEELRDHKARYFDLPGLEADEAEQRKRWCSSCGILHQLLRRPVVRDLVKLASKLRASSPTCCRSPAASPST